MPAGLLFRSVLLPLGLGALLRTGVCAVEPEEPLTTAASLLSLTAEQAGGRLGITVTGIVTAAEPDWNGQFFLQDATGGVFVENLGRPAPAPGDLVTVSGFSHPGAFAPIIGTPTWRVAGRAALPDPKRVLVEHLKAGVEDGWRVEIEGVVRTVREAEDRHTLILAVGGYRLEVFARLDPRLSAVSLTAARVRVRGTAATHYNPAMRHLTAVAVYAPRVEDFELLESQAVQPFDQPILPVNRVAQYRRGSQSDPCVHVRGVVTLQWLGTDVYLQDASGGIRLETSQRELFRPGDQVDAVGFLEYENFQPVLRDAALRRSVEPIASVSPRPVPGTEILRGSHHGSLITLQGRIIGRSQRPVTTLAGGPSVPVTTWLLQGSGFTFTVESASAAGSSPQSEFPIGSVVEVDGVCAPSVDASGKVSLLKVLLPSPSGFRLIARPSWLTAERLLAGVGLLSLGLVVLVLWLLTVAKKNAALKVLIREREQAQRLLQEAHDGLEQKIIERSAQLQVEMTARRTDEVQFRAVLAERTRLARDLHDTLEQTLTGIALHLDATAKLNQRDPTSAQDHLHTARSWLRQSQVDLRRSIWDLRSRELEQFDLAGALRRSAEQLVNGTDIQLEVQTRGTPHRLPEVVEENVLRIGQEALTNIAKHARATQVSILLEFKSDALLLRVTDNGVGFERQHAPNAQEGHFGLLGMGERARRLSGSITVTSSPGQGTTVAVDIPLTTTPAPVSAAPELRSVPLS